MNQQQNSGSEYPPQIPPNSGMPYPPYQAYPYPEEDEISLVELWDVLVAKKKIIILCTIIASLISVVIALTSPVIYRAETLLIPAGEKSKSSGLSSIAAQFGGLASMAGINMGGSSNVAETLAILKSKSFVIDFIKEENLYPILFPEIWDHDKNQWKMVGDEPGPSILKISKAFLGCLSVSQDKKAGLVTLSIEFENPELATQWANKLVIKINTYLREQAVKESKDSIAYLTNQLKKTNKVELQQVLFNLIESQTKTIMLANVREEYAFKVIDPAIVPDTRIKPKRKLIVILGFILGLMGGVFLSFVLNFIDNNKKPAEEDDKT